jgi:hypothetical protein
MRRFIPVVLFLSSLVSAQQRSPTEEFLEHYRRELVFREVENQRSGVEREIASRRHARYLETQFIAKMNRFVALWGALVHDYNEKKVFNIKMAGEVTKAFRDIETTEGWPYSRRQRGEAPSEPRQ